MSIAPRSAAATTEAGGSVELIAQLNRSPVAGTTVVYAVRTSRPQAAHILPGTLTFDESNWESGIRVVITGHPEEDGKEQLASSLQNPAETDDQYVAYWGAEPKDATGRNYTVEIVLLHADDPHFSHPTYTAPGDQIILTNARVLSPALVSGYGSTRRSLPPLTALNLTVAPGSREYTTESGGALALLVSWGAGMPPPPGYPVTFSARTSNNAEAMVSSPSTLTFDAVNYGEAQRVYVVGQLDNVADGNVAYDVVFEFLHSEFAIPAGQGHLVAKPAAVFNTINADVPDPSIGGSPNLTVSMIRSSWSETTPEGGAVTLRAVLTRQPQPGASVVFAVSSSAPHAATVEPGPSILVFDENNWDRGTRVVVTGVAYNGTGVRNDDDFVDASALFAEPLEYTVNFRLVWTDDPFYRASAAQRTSLDGLLAAPSGLGSTLGDAPILSFALTHAAMLNAARSVALKWADVEGYPALVTGSGGEATLFAKLSHAPSRGASVMLAISATWRLRDQQSCGDLGFSYSFMDRQGVTEGPVEGSVDIVENGWYSYSYGSGDAYDNSYGYGSGDGLFGSGDTSTTSSSYDLPTCFGQPKSRAAVVLWPSVIVFTSDDWDATQPIRLRGLDDGSGQYDSVDVTLTRIGETTGDRLFDALLPRVTHIELARAASPPWELLVTYGDDGSATGEAGTEITLIAQLSAPPPNGTVVSFGVTVDDPTEGVVIAPTDLHFTSDNWNMNTYVTVQGVSDTISDGDIPYNVEFQPQHSTLGVTRDALLGSDDAWSGVLGVQVGLLNRDTAKERVGVVFSADASCFNLRQDNESACKVQWALCYPDKDLAQCSEVLSYRDLFYAGISEIYVDVWLEDQIITTPLGIGVQIANLELSTNAPTLAEGFGNYGESDGWNPLVDPTLDGYFSTTLSARRAFQDLAHTEVADPNDKYEWNGAYGTQLTLRCDDDNVKRGAHNMTVRFAAYLYEESGDRFPSTDGTYLPAEKYFVASPSSGSASGISYSNVDHINITVRESADASLRVDGCDTCELTEYGSDCTLRVMFTSLPEDAVKFTVEALSVSDVITPDGRYKGMIVAASGELVSSIEYTMDPSMWHQGIDITIRSVDDGIYEKGLYPTGRVPFSITFTNFASLDSNFDGLTDLAGFTCVAHTYDDETGGFGIEQNGQQPHQGTLASVDENGAFDVFQVHMENEPVAPVWFPIQVQYGLVNVSGPYLTPCPQSAINVSAGVVNGTLCLFFDRDNWSKRQLVM